MLLIIIWSLFHNCFWPRPQPPEIGLVALSSASRFWPRLTSPHKMSCIQQLMLRPTTITTTTTLTTGIGPLNSSMQTLYVTIRNCKVLATYSVSDLHVVRYLLKFCISAFLSVTICSYLEPLRTEDVIPKKLLVLTVTVILLLLIFLGAKFTSVQKVLERKISGTFQSSFHTMFCADDFSQKSSEA